MFSVPNRAFCYWRVAGFIHHVRRPLNSPSLPPLWSLGALLSSNLTKRYAHKKATPRQVKVKDDDDAKKPIFQETGPPRTLLPPSPEQQVAIDTLLQTDNNLIIDACAGSGKTTTILHLARAAPETNFLVLVYNTRLMQETQARVEALGLKNVTVLNYHTLGTRWYTPECSTDQGLKRVVEDDMPVIRGKRLPDFSVLVLDEQQDMTPILKRFVDKLIRDKGFVTKKIRRPKLGPEGKHLRIVVLGDRRQEVYSFNNADSRFLTMAARPEVFGYVNGYGWTLADQTTSNRVTQQNVDFINQQLLKKPVEEAMRAVRSRNAAGVSYPRPRYVICDPEIDLLDEVLRLLKIQGISPTDVIVLAPSVRGISPAIHLANDLALASIGVYRSDSDVAEISPRIAQGKVLICTYHQAKGIERKAAVVLGFDQGYHTYYDKVAEVPQAVSNPQYVAATRALQHLVLIHDRRRAPLPFVNLKTVGKTCELVEVRALKIEPDGEMKGPSTCQVSNLCRNLSETLITECLGHLEVRSVAEPKIGVSPPATEILDRLGLVEGVASITGTAVPAVFQWQRWKESALLKGLRTLLMRPSQSSKRSALQKLPPVYYQHLGSIAEAADAGVLSTESILFLANFSMSSISGDITKVLAIPPNAYTWFLETHCRDMCYTLGRLPAPAAILGKGVFFEKEQTRNFPTIKSGGGPVVPLNNGITLKGAMDICRPKKEAATVWEIKYMDSLHPEHLLQTALYMLLLGDSASGFLVSARTGQTVQVLPKTKGSLMNILQLLVSAKTGGEKSRLLNSYSDEEFLAEARTDFTGLVGRCALPTWFSMRPKEPKYRRKGRKKGGDVEVVE